MRRAFQPTLNRLVLDLVVCSGRNPSGFEVSVSEDSVCIRRFAVVSHYKPVGWMSGFSCDLHRGVFDEPLLHQPAGTRVMLVSCGTG